MLKSFNGNFPNIYFFEVSSEFTNPKMEKLCHFISFISHFVVFCSKSSPTENEFKNLNNYLMLSYFQGSLINISSNSTPLFLGVGKSKKKAEINIDIDRIDEYNFANYLFRSIIKIKLDFIPSETIASLFYLVIDKENDSILNNDKKTFLYSEKMQNYSQQIHNKTIEYFQNQIHKMIDQIYSTLDPKKYINNFNLNDKLNYILDKTQEYYYTNIYVEFWDEYEIEKTSKVLISEVKNDFNSSFLPIKQLEAIGKLISFDSKQYSTSLSEIQSIITFINSFDSSFNPKSIPKTQKEIQLFKSKSQNLYGNLVKSILYNCDLSKTFQSFSDQLYSFLNQNPIASDIEYSQFYHNLYLEKIKTIDSNIELYVNKSLTIRKVLDEYKPKKYTIQINEKSFNFERIKLHINSIDFILNSSFTCHDFFELVKKSFNLVDIPFHIIRKKLNKLKKTIEVEVFDDDVELNLLKTNNFVIYYGSHNYSTKNYIESMIVKKTIKISNDFIIKSNSKNADYTVEFDPNHNGWLDVEFDIKNHSKSIKESDITLLFLTINDSESEFLNKGNIIEHQSYQNGKWITEDDPVFISFPDCKTIVFPLHHCSPHKVTGVPFECLDAKEEIEEKDEKEEIDEKEKKDEKEDEKEKKDEKEEEDIIDEDTKEKLLNKKFSRHWNDENGDIQYFRGGQSYYLPVGFLSHGIYVKNYKSYTCVGFHGTFANVVFKIIKDGFKLPSELKNGVRKFHWKINETHHRIKCFANAIFVTPSINYATIYAYEKIEAETEDSIYFSSGHVKNKNIRIIILQTRVTPNEYQIFPNSLYYEINDSHYSQKQMEWRITNKSNIFPYRILYKYLSKEEFDKLMTKINNKYIG